MRILFSTGNEGKFEEASHALRELIPGCTVLRANVDPVEVQGRCDDIAAEKTRCALRLAREQGVDLTGVHVFVTEDVSFHLACLNGFPGPYVKDLLDAVGETGLWDIVRRFEDHGASTVCTLGAVDLRQGAGAPVQLFRGELRGTVVPPRGDVRHGAKSWNSSFQPEGQTRTFGEVPIDEQAQFSHRHLALKAFAQHMRATMTT